MDVLYAGAANLSRPSSGTDLCARCHLDELFDDRSIALKVVSVSPNPPGPEAMAPPVTLIPSDFAGGSSARQRLFGKLGLLARGGILFQTGFLSKAARAELRAQLARGPDVLLVDHVTALANISPLQLLRTRLRGRTKIVLIAHDISAALLRDRARLHPSRLKRLAIQLHALHCQLYEAAMFGLAHRVLFISADDRERFGAVRRAKTEVLCPLVELPVGAPAAAGSFGRFLIFVGSASFFPNAAALEWIVRRFAPRLLERDPDLRILLAGRGTDGVAVDAPANVVGLGFVDDDRLHELLRTSCGALSPVVHGSGLKIKVLEAIAAGCAIFATAESLRGYEFMQLEPLLAVDDPAGSVERVVAVVGDPAKLHRYEQDVAARWHGFQTRRRGQLADLVRRLGRDVVPA